MFLGTRPFVCNYRKVSQKQDCIQNIVINTYVLKLVDNNTAIFNFDKQLENKNLEA